MARLLVLCLLGSLPLSVCASPPSPPQEAFSFTSAGLDSNRRHEALLATCYGRRIAVSLMGYTIVNPGVVLARAPVAVSLLGLLVRQFEVLPSQCVEAGGSEEAVLNHLLRTGAFYSFHLVVSEFPNNNVACTAGGDSEYDGTGWAAVVCCVRRPITGAL